MRTEIAELLRESTAPHLADCLDYIEDKYLKAIHGLIIYNREHKKPRESTRIQVVNDIAALLEEKPAYATYSKPFLKTV